MQSRWTWDLPVTPEALWPRIADTNRFNRDAAVPDIEGETPGFCTVRNGRRRLRQRRLGFMLEWDEDPFEWVRPHHFSVVRRYLTGPMGELHVRVTITPTATGSRVHYDLDAVPRRPHLRLPTRVVMGVARESRFRRIFEQYARDAALDPPRLVMSAPLPIISTTPATLAPGGRQRLDETAAALRVECGPDLTTHITTLIAYGDDLTLARIRPYALADLWRTHRGGVLRALLHATRLGMLDLQWDVICPKCRGAKATAGTLSELQTHVYCECCHANIDTEFERSVELTFRPAQAIRPIETHAYCVGGPMVTPHIVLQQLMPASSSRDMQVHLLPGSYRLRTMDRAGGRSVIVAQEDAATSVVEIPAGDWPEADLSLSQSALLRLTNAGAEDELVILERVAWADDAVTAAEAFRLQDFRDLFARETLRPGQHLAVGNLAVLFTDVRDSTRLYRDIGDAVAYARMREHFDVLRTAIVREDGVLVKTIGDSVMAVFPTPLAAVRAVMRAAELLGADPHGVQPIQLKAGLHYGPCIAVTLNDALDYFGSTVNIAARLGGLARGGDIVISETAFADGEIAALAATQAVGASPFDAILKGISNEPVRVWRVDLDRRAGNC